MTRSGRLGRTGLVPILALSIGLAACAPAASPTPPATPVAQMPREDPTIQAPPTTPTPASPPAVTVSPAVSTSPVPRDGASSSPTPLPLARPTADVPVGTNVGQRLPSFTVTRVDGTVIRSADLFVEEKPYILYFFATW